MAESDHRIPPIVICEVANTHGGSLNLFRKTIERFSEIEYPALHIKLQAIHADSIALPDFEYYPTYQELEFSLDEWEQLIDIASKRYSGVWLDLFDVFGVSLLQAYQDKIYGVKLQASVLGNNEVISALRTLDLSQQQLMVNVSGYPLDEIERIIGVLSELNSAHMILQIGFQSYPTKLQDTALNKLAVLRERFPGYALCMADHLDGTDLFAALLPAVAVGAGADYVEKHIVLNRDEAPYDAASALEFEAFQQMTDWVVQANDSLADDFISEAEAHYLSSTIQVPVTSRAVRAGTLIGESDVVYRRTAQAGLTMPEIQALQNDFQLLARDCAGNKALTADHFKPAKIATIIACRLKSTRLKNKAELPIGGMASIERCIESCKQFEHVDSVILATSTNPQDAPLEKHAAAQHVPITYGSEDDVVGRYIDVCDTHNIDVIIRITGDNPCPSPEIAKRVLESHFASGADYSAPERCTVGTGVEVFNLDALRTIKSHFPSADYSEYMTWYFTNNPEAFKLNFVPIPEEIYREDYRLTLDYPEDLELFEALYAKLEEAGLPATTVNVVSVLDKHPEIAELNQMWSPVYTTNDALIDTLNQKTKFGT